MKPAVALVFLLITKASAVPVLTVALFFDAMLNAGNAIATNGYMLKVSPKENRSAFVAATLALTGICGGIASIFSGTILRHTEGFSPTVWGRTWNHYQLIFLISFLLRTVCIPLAVAVKEQKSAATSEVLDYLMELWPMRVLTLPIGLYRKLFKDDENSPS